MQELPTDRVVPIPDRRRELPARLVKREDEQIRG